MSQIDLCARCGRCLISCPVYEVSRIETLSPRGRVRLAQELCQGYKPTAASFFTCLLCGACEEACPNQISLLQAFCEVRAQLHPRLKGLLAQGWPKVLKAVESGLTLLGEKLPLTKPFVKRQNLPETGDVLLFLGCGANLIFPQVTETLTSLLASKGLRLGLPSGQGCCGLATLALGDEETFRQLAKANLRALAGEKKVLTLCASCYFALKVLYPRLFKEGPWAKAAQDLANRIEEATGFLLAHGARWVPRSAGVLHVPCHQRFAPISPWWRKGPWEVLEACCGQGGSFGVFYPELSQAIAKTWRQGLAQLPFVPEVLLTNCTACYVRFKQESLPGLEIRFPLEFLEI